MNCNCIGKDKGKLLMVDKVIFHHHELSLYLFNIIWIIEGQLKLMSSSITYFTCCPYSYAFELTFTSEETAFAFCLRTSRVMHGNYQLPTSSTGSPCHIRSIMVNTHTKDYKSSLWDIGPLLKMLIMKHRRSIYTYL